jgi:hypothetical protein
VAGGQHLSPGVMQIYITPWKLTGKCGHTLLDFPLVNRDFAYSWILFYSYI